MTQEIINQAVKIINSIGNFMMGLHEIHLSNWDWVFIAIGIFILFTFPLFFNRDNKFL